MPTVILSQNHLDDLLKFHIFSTRTGMLRQKQNPIQRFKVGDKINFLPNCVIEEHSTIAAGSNLFSSGYLTASASSFPMESKIGRFTEIAINVNTNIGWRHPFEAVCMSSPVFNFYREYVSSYFYEYEKNNGEVEKTPVPTPQTKSSLYIGNDVWIGQNVILKPNIKVGDGAIVASHSLLTKDVEPYTLVAGVPAVYKKHRFPKEIIKELQNIQFWNYELGDFFKNKINFSKPKEFIDEFYKKSHLLRVYNPKKFYPIQYFSLDNFNLLEKIKDNKDFLITYFGQIVCYNSSNNQLISAIKPQNNYFPITIKHKENNQINLFIDELQKYIKFVDEKITLTDDDKDAISILNVASNEVKTYGLEIEKGKFLGAVENSATIKIMPHCKWWEHFYFSNQSFPDSILLK